MRIWETKNTSPQNTAVGDQNTPPQDVPFWHKDYFKSLQTQETLWEPGKKFPFLKGKPHLQRNLQQRRGLPLYQEEKTTHSWNSYQGKICKTSLAVVSWCVSLLPSDNWSAHTLLSLFPWKMLFKPEVKAASLKFTFFPWVSPMCTWGIQVANLCFSFNKLLLLGFFPMEDFEVLSFIVSKDFLLISKGNLNSSLS